MPDGLCYYNNNIKIITNSTERMVMKKFMSLLIASGLMFSALNATSKAKTKRPTLNERLTELKELVDDHEKRLTALEKEQEKESKTEEPDNE